MTTRRYWALAFYAVGLIVNVVGATHKAQDWGSFLAGTGLYLAWTGGRLWEGGRL